LGKIHRGHSICSFFAGEDKFFTGEYILLGFSTGEATGPYFTGALGQGMEK